MPLDEDATRIPNAPSVPEQTSADDAQPQNPRTTSTFESPVAAPGSLLTELVEVALFLEQHLYGEICPRCGWDVDRPDGYGCEESPHEPTCPVGQTIQRARRASKENA